MTNKRVYFGILLYVGDIWKPVTFRIDLCSSVYILKSLLKSVSALRVLELQELIFRSLYGAIDLAELLFTSD